MVWYSVCFSRDVVRCVAACHGMTSYSRAVSFALGQSIVFHHVFFRRDSNIVWHDSSGSINSSINGSSPSSMTLNQRIYVCILRSILLFDVPGICIVFNFFKRS